MIPDQTVYWFQVECEYVGLCLKIGYDAFKQAQKSNLLTNL